MVNERYTYFNEELQRYRLTLNKKFDNGTFDFERYLKLVTILDLWEVQIKMNR
ncbi:hypothetical protein [Psychrobacillus phage Perkons]|nr:hypothetical protein [Psychrobacillus phage Perkons]